MHTTLKKQFTLVEILTVIAIISILAGILFPTLSKVMDKARATTTKDTMVSVVQAVDSFYSTYEYMIDYGSNSKTFDDTAVSKYGEFAEKGGVQPGTDYYNFFDILCYTNHSAKSKNVKATGEATTYNKQAVRFLATPKKYYTNNSNKFEDSVRDAWDQPFVIFLNVDSSDVITVTDDKYAKGTYTANCFLFSVGVPTGKDEVDSQVKAGYIKSMD